MVKGTFSTHGTIPNIDDKRVEFHVGWIQNTLPPFIQSMRAEPGNAILVHIDVDLYSAALFILTTLWHFIDKCYVVFDEFGVDENLAFADFLTAYPADVRFFNHTFNPKFRGPQQVFCNVQRKEYAIENVSEDTK